MHMGGGTGPPPAYEEAHTMFGHLTTATTADETSIMHGTHPLSTGWAITYNPGTGDWQAWEHGHPLIAGRPSLESTLFSLVPAFSHGYAVSYYTCDDDGDVYDGPLCADCVRTVIAQTMVDDAQLDPGVHLHPDLGFRHELVDGDAPYFGAVECTACGEVLARWQCIECGDSLETDHDHDGLPVFGDDDGRGMHGACLSRLVAKGDATKTGHQTYTIGVSTPYSWVRGVFRYRYQVPAPLAPKHEPNW